MDSPPPSPPISKVEAKAAFGRRLYTLMTARAWRQSDLARHSGLPRDAISSYVRGKVFPTPQSIEALCKAFGISRDELTPFSVDPTLPAVQNFDEKPAFEATFLYDNEGDRPIHLKLNQRVTFPQLQIIASALGYTTGGDGTQDRT